MSDRDRQRPDDEALARLLRASGRGPAASPEARARIHSAVREHWRASLPARAPAIDAPRPMRRGSPATRFLALAAGLAAVAIVAYRLQIPGMETDPFATIARVDGTVEIRRGDDVRLARDVATTMRIGDVIATGTGARLALELATGQSLRVDSESELAVVEAGRVELRAGTVYFDSIGRVASAPLVIETAIGSVQHVGTQFEASLVGQGLRIRVREGSVAFRDRGRELTATAGEQLQVEQSGAPQRMPIAPDDPAWDWAENLAAVPAAVQHPLAEILEWISRETGRTLAFEDPATESRARDVVVYELAGLNPGQALVAVRSTTDFGYVDSNDTLLVTGSGR